MGVPIMKLCSLCTMVAIATMLSPEVQGIYDSDFCDKHLGQMDKAGAGGQQPVFFDNFRVFIEQKLVTQRQTVYIDEYYSQEGGLLYARMNSRPSPYQIWINTNLGGLVQLPITSGVCTDNPFNNSKPYHFFGATTDSDGNVVLNSPGAALHWDEKKRKKIMFKGDGESRGIKTMRWMTCEYEEYLDATTATEWHIVDPQITLPAVDNSSTSKPVLPVSATVFGIDKSNASEVFEFQYRYDFTHFERIQTNDPAFQLPPNKLCAGNSKSKKPLPEVPDYFKFKGEQVETSSENNPPSLVYTIEEFMHSVGLFVQDFVTTPKQDANGNDKTYVRKVDDFTSGLSYVLDLTTGACVTSPIHAGIDANTAGRGLVYMRNASQFFDFDAGSYRYMGVHTKRGIDCDTWSAYITDTTGAQQSTLYTWYFASPAWMKSKHFSTIFTLPVALDVTTDDKQTEFNIYEFTTESNAEFPDVSACYSPENIMNMEVFLQGSYDAVVSPDPAAFKRKAFLALMSGTRITSSLRIAGLDVQPAANNEIVLRFKLLDRPTVKGDVSNALDEPTNTLVYQHLVDSVDTGKFVIFAGDEGQTPVYARPQSAGQTRAGRFQTRGGSTTSLTAGVMAGVAIGMFAFGFLLGIVVVALVKRLRRISTEGGVAMSRLSEEQIS